MRKNCNALVDLQGYMLAYSVDINAVQMFNRKIIISLMSRYKIFQDVISSEFKFFNSSKITKLDFPRGMTIFKLLKFSFKNFRIVPNLSANMRDFSLLKSKIRKISKKFIYQNMDFTVARWTSENPKLKKFFQHSVNILFFSDQKAPIDEPQVVSVSSKSSIDYRSDQMVLFYQFPLISPSTHLIPMLNTRATSLIVRSVK